MRWTTRPSTPDDATWIAELRAVVMRPDLERLGVYDETRVRQRFLDAFDPALTRVIVIDGADAGSIAARPTSDGTWLEHFYLDERVQGAGIGTEVLAAALAEDHPLPWRLNVLQGSPARRLYERHGFTLESEDEVDVFLVRRH
ncbi:GNAT family N-acetyltransferase [Microbacterium oleivorans]|uniref:GNAT family N-acetyltransferase n=1 Tax=Microbacterium oleivorans TaxID=273677 RepID=UPI00080DF0E9|nr:GNAT family N-acetyltransferase [Microbacterium oleivorans]